jgi:hypothetical protein
MIDQKLSHLDVSAKEEIEMKRQLINRIKVFTCLYRLITEKSCFSPIKKFKIDHLLVQNHSIPQLSLRLSLSLKLMQAFLIKIKE